MRVCLVYLLNKFCYIVALSLFLNSIGVANSTASQNYFLSSYALVIGIDSYENASYWADLPYGWKDALAIANILQEQGYEVTTLTNEEAARENILWTLSSEIAPKLSGRDRVVVFYSGHGETGEVGWRDFGYIVPYDGTDQFPTWISMSEIRELSEHMIRARHQLFIFDSCYGGSIGQKGGTFKSSEESPRYIEKISSNRAHQFITAGGKGEIVLDRGPHGYSYFTGYLLEALSGKADFDQDSYVTMSELSSFLLSAGSNWSQTPRWGVLPEHDQGEFWFRVTENPQSIWTIVKSTPEFLNGFSESKVSVEPKEPQFLTHPQGPIDNLTSIPGITIGTQAKLYEIGIFTIGK